VQSASTALANGIRSARQFFYIEDQYFVGSNEMAKAISAVFSNSKIIGIIVIASEDSVIDTPDVGFRRRDFLQPLVKSFPTQLLVFERLGQDGTTTGKGAYVHSKLLMVDDEAAFIGSVNSNRRSWFHDSEIDVTIVDPGGPGGTTPGTRGWIREIRCQLWSRHLNIPTAALGDPTTDIFQWFGVISGLTLGTSVRPYDVAAVVPRYTIKGVQLADPILQIGWDTLEDPA
jgi:phosphatidylserine/phosphatidylglycerophosphate/cardiolipin synthase-like enzyme